MAKNVKILLEKTYPSLKEKMKMDESTPHLIDINFFIQNSKRYINKVLLKNNIENLILEQEYDVLVIPSNLYSDETSMKKLKDFYDKFYEENQLDRFQPFLDEKLKFSYYGGVTNIYLQLLFNAAPCLRDIKLELMNYNSKHQIRKEFSNCISNALLPATMKKFPNKERGILNRVKQISDHEMYLRRAFSRILPWAIILEWVCSMESKSQTHIKIHFSQTFLDKMLSSVNALNRNLRIEEKPKAKKKTPKAKKKTSKAIVNLTKAETNESEASISHSTKRKRTSSMTSEAPESSKLGLKNPRFGTCYKK
ncbi:hypothetical protein HMI54_014658 [Coelomomyces lativittatus]|nr:hypothetical protein HMI54_014658 [Coelomomyces lativittatus]